MVARIVNYRRSKEQGGENASQDNQIDSKQSVKKATPSKGKHLGKRAREPSANPSEHKTSTNVPTEKDK